MWTCPRCGERGEDQFDACWSCGATREGEVQARTEPEDDERRAGAPPAEPRGQRPPPAAPGRSSYPVLRLLGGLSIVLGMISLVLGPIALFAGFVMSCAGAGDRTSFLTTLVGLVLAVGGYLLGRAGREARALLDAVERRGVTRGRQAA